MENTQLNFWEKTFVQFLDLTEFALVKKENKLFALEDLQGGGFYCDDEFSNAFEIFDRMDSVIEDYVLASLEHCLDYYGWEETIPNTCEEWIEFRKNNPLHIICYENTFEFQVCDMIVNHYNDINLNNLFD